MAHNVKPPKPAGQGDKAPANVQQVNEFNKPGPSNTANAGVPVTGPAGGWQEHANRSNPGGYGG